MGFNSSLAARVGRHFFQCNLQTKRVKYLQELNHDIRHHYRGSYPTLLDAPSQQWQQQQQLPQQQYQGAAKISRYAFPEYDDECNAKEFAQRRQSLRELGLDPSVNGSSDHLHHLNRHDRYLEEVYSLNNTNASNAGALVGESNSFHSSTGDDNLTSLPCHHVFSHRLAGGHTIHGHVRPHQQCIESKTNYHPYIL
jgi:hypothetical protein